jgi:hypothetical protein
LTTILTATRLETWAARRALPRERVIRVGVGCERGVPNLESPAIVCGVCGGLAPLATGTIVIPEEVIAPDGRSWRCTPNLVSRLRAGARRLGGLAVGGPLLSSPSLVTGEERGRWAEQGLQTVDMESALILERGPAAVLRVVLDMPYRDLSPRWEQPAAALLRPAGWRDLAWLVRAAPATATRAAAVVRAALSQ